MLNLPQNTKMSNQTDNLKEVKPRCVHSHTLEEIAFYGCEINPKYLGTALPNLQKPDNLKPEGLEDLIRQFNIDYLSEYRWAKDRINHLSAEDWLIVNIKSLLSQTKEETKRELRQKIEGMRATPKGTVPNDNYNQALQEVLNLIK